jgi:hypothetical protein
MSNTKQETTFDRIAKMTYRSRDGKPTSLGTLVGATDPGTAHIVMAICELTDAIRSQTQVLNKIHVAIQNK